MFESELSYFKVFESELSSDGLVWPRFRTDPNDPGTEKLSVWPPMESFLEAKYAQLDHLPGTCCHSFLLWLFFTESIHVCGFACTAYCLTGAEDLLRPFSVAYVKGWRRSLACLMCLEAVRSIGLPLDELTNNFKVTCVS